jgi:hypothetical protein
MKLRKLTSTENAFWILWCVLTFGAPWFVKVLIKKAVIEALNTEPGE